MNETISCYDSIHNGNYSYRFSDFCYSYVKSIPLYSCGRIGDFVAYDAGRYKKEEVKYIKEKCEQENDNINVKRIPTVGLNKNGIYNNRNWRIFDIIGKSVIIVNTEAVVPLLYKSIQCDDIFWNMYKRKNFACDSKPLELNRMLKFLERDFLTQEKIDTLFTTKYDYLIPKKLSNEIWYYSNKLNLLISIDELSYGKNWSVRPIVVLEKSILTNGQNNLGEWKLISKNV